MACCQVHARYEARGSNPPQATCKIANTTRWSAPHGARGGTCTRTDRSLNPVPLLLDYSCMLPRTLWWFCTSENLRCSGITCPLPLVSGRCQDLDDSCESKRGDRYRWRDSNPHCTRSKRVASYHCATPACCRADGETCTPTPSRAAASETAKSAIPSHPHFARLWDLHPPSPAHARGTMLLLSCTALVEYLGVAPSASCIRSRPHTPRVVLDVVAAEGIEPSWHRV